MAIFVSIYVKPGWPVNGQRYVMGGEICCENQQISIRQEWRGFQGEEAGESGPCHLFEPYPSPAGTPP